MVKTPVGVAWETGAPGADGALTDADPVAVDERFLFRNAHDHDDRPLGGAFGMPDEVARLERECRIWFGRDRRFRLSNKQRDGNRQASENMH